MLLKRKQEAGLILVAALFLLLGLTNLWLLDSQKWDLIMFFSGGLLVALFVLLSTILSKWNFQGDQYIVPLFVILSFIGCILLYRLSPQVAVKQLYWHLVGVAAFLFVIRFIGDYTRLEDYKYVYIITGLALLLLTILFGVEVGGARSWISFGVIRFQPSEIVKIVLVIFLASYLEEERKVLVSGSREILGLAVPGIRNLGPVVLMCGFSLVLLVFQKDLGTALLFFGTFLAMIYLATGRWFYIISGSAMFSLGAVFCYYLFTHVQVRVAIWLNPWADIDGRGYQIVQSLFSLAAGGLTGTGIGLGSPGLIPAVHTDFVFSAWAEETGMLGAVALVLLYLILIYRGLVIAAKSRNSFGTLLAGGLSALLGIQTFVIMAGVIKLLPLTGVTLPFVSYGGSSLVSSYVLAALLLVISNGDRALEKE